MTDSTSWAVDWRLPGILLVAFVLRAARLMSLLPIMIDENIYLRWAEIIEHQHQWFISLLDGKTPLCFWMFAIARMAWPRDPLLASRILSVGMGVASTYVLYALVRRLVGETAGLLAALLYAVMPYGVLYDRIAYTDSFVNAGGLCMAYAVVACFEAPNATHRRAVVAGLALGLAYFAKPTALLLAFLPVPIALWYQWGHWGLIARRLAVIFVVAACFPLLCALAMPPGPQPDFDSVIFHHTTFFTTPGELFRQPLVNVSTNLTLLGGYLLYYATLPLMTATAIALVVLARKRQVLILLLFLAWPLPIAFQVIDLKWFPSRYVFPHMWACIVAIAAAFAAFQGSPRRLPRIAATALASSMAIQSVLMLAVPRSFLHPDDANEHLGSGPFSGFGVREAVDYLAAQARDEPVAVITEPVWGPPSDAIHAYLNHTRRITVFDGWWLQVSPNRRVVPTESVEVMKSQYERVSAGTVDFASFARIYFVTATNYQQPSQVYIREPHAKLVARFSKPNGVDSVDVYLMSGSRQGRQ